MTMQAPGHGAHDAFIVSAAANPRLYHPPGILALHER